MKVDIQEKGSLYTGQKKPPFFSAPRLFPLLLLLAGLITVHFLNLYLQWSVIRRELAEKPGFQSPEYTFLGFSLFNRREIEAARRLPNAAPTGRIFAYFDFFHPVVFMVWNNGGEGDFFDLGPVLAAFPAGASRVIFFAGSVFQLDHKKSTVARNFGGSILGGAWAGYLNKKSDGRNRAGKSPSGSFIVKPAHGSLSIKIPYLIYFVLPLALIVVLIIHSGPAMAVSFFYFMGMFFCFDFQKLFVAVPLAWLFNTLGLELTDGWVKVLALALALLFLAASVYGLWRWKDRELAPSGKWLVMFFILLPPFLFF